MSKKKNRARNQIAIVSDGLRTAVSINGHLLNHSTKIEFHHDSASEWNKPTVCLNIELKELLGLIKK